jgi:histidyl-tRNA synthetase
MVPDSEILCILVEALTALDIGEFTVKVGPLLCLALRR